MSILSLGEPFHVRGFCVGECLGHNGDLPREVDAIAWGDATCSGDEVGGSGHHRDRIALDAAPYVAHQLSQGQNHDKHVVLVCFRVQGLRWLGWT